MKTLENLSNVQLYESTDVLPDRFTSGNITRLTVGRTYNVIGLCHVAESKNSAGEKINAWDGVLIENAATGKQFPVSVNSLFAIGFYRKSPTAKAEVRRTERLSPFTNIEDVVSTASFDVVGSEKIEITDFNGKKVLKDFYHFDNLELLQREQIPTFAKAAKVEVKAETKRRGKN